MQVISLAQARRRLHERFEDAARLSFIERDFARALRDARKAVRHGPDCHQGHVLLGDVLCALGREGEALVCYHRALRLAPKEAEPCWSISTVHFLRGRFEHALRYLKLARDRLRRGDGPLYEWIAEDLAVALLRLGRHDEALAAVRWGLRRRPRDERLRELRTEIQAFGRPAARRLRPV